MDEGIIDNITAEAISHVDSCSESTFSGSSHSTGIKTI